MGVLLALPICYCCGLYIDRYACACEAGTCLPCNRAEKARLDADDEEPW